MIESIDQDILDDVNFGTTIIEFQRYLNEKGLTYNEWANQAYVEFCRKDVYEQEKILERNRKVREEKEKLYNQEPAWDVTESRGDGWSI